MPRSESENRKGRETKKKTTRRKSGGTQELEEARLEGTPEPTTQQQSDCCIEQLGSERSKRKEASEQCSRKLVGIDAKGNAKDLLPLKTRIRATQQQSYGLGSCRKGKRKHARELNIHRAESKTNRQQAIWLGSCKKRRKEASF